MKKNIYMLMNEVSTKTSAYPEIELTEAELQKYRMNLKNRLGKKRWKAVFATLAFAACAALMATLVYFKPIEQRMRASTGTVTYSLSAMLGVSSELEEHVLHIGETQRMDGLTVTLNTVAADDEQLIIYTTQVFEDTEKVPRLSTVSWGRGYDQGFEGTSSLLAVPVKSGTAEYPRYEDWLYTDDCVPIQRVWINGEELRCDVTGEGTALQKGVLQDVVQYNFPVSELVYPAEVRVEVYSDGSQKKPGAVFEFTLDEDSMISNEKDVQLNTTLQLPDGEELTVKRFTYNPLGMKIFAEYKNNWNHFKDDGWHFSLRSREAEGHTQYFMEYPLTDKEVVFIPMDSNMHEDVARFDEWELEAAIYRSVEGQEGPDREKLDDVIKIPLK